MGTRRSRHNKGRKPLYKEHRLNLIDGTPLPGSDGAHNICKRCGAACWGNTCETCYRRGSAFLGSERAKSLDIDVIAQLSEAAAQTLFEQIRWHESDGKPVCPSCDGLDHYSHTRADGIHRWECKACRSEFGSRSGTLFDGGKKGFMGALLAIAAFAQTVDGSATVLRRAEEMGVTYKAAEQFSQRVRHVVAPPAMTPEQFVLGKSRYNGFGWMATRTWWTDAEKDALRTFAAANAPPELCADALGRSPSSLLAYGRELKLKFPVAWGGRKPRVIKPPSERRIELQYPYILKPRDESAQLLEVNALVPKGLPPHMRADICQEIMLSLFEGRVTIEEVRRMKDKMRWFIGKFYKDNFEDSGRAVSLTGVNSDGDEYDRVAAGISEDEWRFEQMNDQRSAWDAVNRRIHAPTQEHDTYFSQIKNEQRRNHDDFLLLDVGEAEDALSQLDPKTMRHREFEYKSHTALRLKERYGIRPTPEVWKELRLAVFEDRVRVVSGTDREGGQIGWVRVQGRNVRIVFDPEAKQFITVLPPSDERSLRPTFSARELAESFFK